MKQAALPMRTEPLLPPMRQPALSAARAEIVTLIPFEWTTPIGIQQVVYVDRRRLH